MASLTEQIRDLKSLEVTSVLDSNNKRFTHVESFLNEAVDYQTLKPLRNLLVKLRAQSAMHSFKGAFHPVPGEDPYIANALESLLGFIKTHQESIRLLMKYIHAADFYRNWEDAQKDFNDEGGDQDLGCRTDTGIRRPKARSDSRQPVSILDEPPHYDRGPREALSRATSTAHGRANPNNSLRREDMPFHP
ncbi:uncharacterized protein KY384_007534 [Bacidia gigantensis]|uniref:uncharacterized protein n=1 Tax=Bacidia gigantensis TaxID=2732470 RepID=UPI001D044067|nr:uncharacterized protein KY384_007534 [Bacidia gigantensis]KAG8527382.1 hypothetical protein KY384_007534 [Bacidia gigantensis]